VTLDAILERADVLTEKGECWLSKHGETA